MKRNIYVIYVTHTHICIIARTIFAHCITSAHTCQGLEYLLSICYMSGSVSGGCRTHILVYIPEVPDTKPKQSKPVNVII